MTRFASLPLISSDARRPADLWTEVRVRAVKVEYTTEGDGGVGEEEGFGLKTKPLAGEKEGEGGWGSAA